MKKNIMTVMWLCHSFFMGFQKIEFAISEVTLLLYHHMLKTKINGTALSLSKESLSGELLESYNIANIKFTKENSDILERLSRNNILLKDLIHEIDNDFSYEDIWAIVNVCCAVGVPMTYLAVLGELSSSVSEKISIKQPRYMHAIWNIEPSLIDFKKYFIYGIHPMSSWAGAAELPMYSTVEARYALNTFYMNYDFNTLFDNFGSRENDIIVSLQKSRSETVDYTTFNLELFCEKDPKFFKRVERVKRDDIWSCEQVSKVGPQPVGEQVYTSLAEFRDRLSKYTYGMLEKSPNPDMENEVFDWDGICLAGGCVEQCTRNAPEYNPVPASDVDIFVYGRTYKEAKENTNRMIKWFQSPNTYFGVVGSVVYVYILDCPRVFQIISTDKRLPSEIISDFDLAHIQYAFFSPNTRYNLKGKNRTIENYQIGSLETIHCVPFSGLYAVIATKDAIDSAVTGLSRVLKGPRTDGSRVLKGMRRGYDILPTKDIIEDCDVMKLIADNSHIYKEIIQNLNSHWFPRKLDIEGLTKEEAADKIEGMIRKMSKSVITTDDVAAVRDHITYGGNFASDYAMLCVDNFRPERVRNLRPNRYTSTYLQGIASRIQILTKTGVVTRVLHSEDNITIDVSYDDPKFREFVEQTLETNVLRLVTQQPVTNKLLKNNTITYKMSNAEIKAREDRNIVVSRRINGDPISTHEDIKVGTKIQVLVQIHLKSHENDNIREFTFIPKKFLIMDVDEPKKAAVNANDDEDDDDTPTDDKKKITSAPQFAEPSFDDEDHDDK